MFDHEIKSDRNGLHARKLKWKSVQTGELNYLCYLPPDYSANAAKKWPLMLFLHGAGERGNDVQRVAIHGPLSLVKRGTNFPFIIIAPQCPAGQLWDNVALLQLLDHSIAQFNVDTNRVYLTGLSMGGYGTWSLAIAHPEKFAAIAPICGGANMIDVLLGSVDRHDEIKRLPMWVFHGAKDDVVPVSESERVVNALRKLGVAELELTVYPEAKHDSWKQAYDDLKLYDWFLKHKRPAR